jgi:hypothetical protein
MPKLAADKAPEWTRQVVGRALKGVKLKGLLAADMKTVDPLKLSPIVRVAMDAAEGMMTPEAAAAPAGAGPDDVIMKLLEHVVQGAAEQKAMPGAEVDEDAAEPANPAAATGAAAAPSGEGANPQLMGFLKDQCGLDDANLAKVAEMLKPSAAAPGEKKPGEDEELDENGNPKKKAEDDMPNNAITEKAMDEAIQAAVKSERERSAATSSAREFVRPWVGQLPVALDSEPKVLRAALKIMGVGDVDKLHKSALRPILQNIPKPGAAQRSSTTQPAMDAAAATSFLERYKGAADIGVL